MHTSCTIIIEGGITISVFVCFWDTLYHLLITIDRVMGIGEETEEVNLAMVGTAHAQ